MPAPPPLETTLPDPPRPRKPRRVGLYAPFVLLIIGAAAWSAGWLWLKGRVERGMDEASTGLAASGYEIGWSQRRVYGYPFRIDVDLTDFRAREPGGWAIAAPALKLEAYAFAPDHWLAAAPSGITFTRPLGGPVAVRARVLRASLSHPGGRPPWISVEGLDLAFTPAAGARPFFLTEAKELHLHLRSGGTDQAALYAEVTGAKARLTGLFGRIAEGKPVSLAAQAMLSHASALHGADWPSAVRAWTAAGGAADVQRVRILAGDALLEAKGGPLSVGDDGRLRGSLSATLRQAPRALAAMGQEGVIAPEAAGAATIVAGVHSQGDIATITLDFQAGLTTLGPVAIGPAPKVY
jgi:hypothetical protein